MRNILKSCLQTTVFLFFLSSCAWSTKWFQKGAVATNEQLTEVGANEEELKKFSVQETAEEPVKEEAKEEVKPEVVKPVVSATPSKQKITKPKKEAPKKVIAPVKKEVPKSLYPKDYPEDYKTVDIETEKTWKLFSPKFKTNEQMFLDVDYMGLTVGKVVLSYRGIKSMNTKPVHHFQAVFKSAPFYSAIYELDDKLDTFVDQEHFVGLRYNLVQRESKQDVDEVQLYDRETLKTTAYQKWVRKDKVKNNKWEGFIPRFSIDPLSVFWLIRGMPFKEKDKYTIPIVNKGKLLIMEANVEEREKIKTKLGESQSIRVKVHTVYTGKTLKSGDMTFWFSDDDTRRLLRAQAKIQIGSVYAEAVKGD
ncbi:MAG: DUF3108 domain-containing protein [Bacteriovoracaceae bacterium]|nr:DUF3108 domain-containing protein [Bacteriovoracaceae bacterium]